MGGGGGQQATRGLDARAPEGDLQSAAGMQASRVSIGGAAWGVTGWAVVLGWTVVLSLAAVWAYRRDDGRA